MAYEDFQNSEEPGGWTGHAQDPDWWALNSVPSSSATASAKAVQPGDPGTYAQNGMWYDPQGNVIAYGQWFNNQGQETFPSYSVPTTQPTPEPAAAESFGGPVAPFDQAANPYPVFTPPPLPDYLQKGFELPTAADLQATPGYMARYQMGLDARQRSAAAHGTILNGGTQKALDRYGQDYASNEYSNLAQQKLSERQQQSADYLNLAYGPAWQQNQAAVNQYGQLYKQYQDLIGNNRNSQNDYWQHQLDLLNAGLTAARSGSPGTTGGQG